MCPRCALIDVTLVVSTIGQRAVPAAAWGRLMRTVPNLDLVPEYRQRPGAHRLQPAAAALFDAYWRSNVSVYGENEGSS